MIVRWSSVLTLLALPLAHGGDLRFLNGDGGPLPPRLQAIAAAFSAPGVDFSHDENREALADAIVRWANAHDHPVFYASVQPPDRHGVTTVTLTDGKTGNVIVEGGKHLAAERIASRLRIRSGEPLHGRSLQEELDWLQRNPFHSATLAASPGATADTADIAFTLTDARPVSFLAGYDNQGVAPLGDSRYRAAVQWGNALGLDHQMALQVMTADDTGTYRSLAGEWTIPLPWRHELRLSGAWAATSVTSDYENGALDSDGTLWAASLRYAVPLRLTKTRTAEMFSGFDYRKFDTGVTFGDSALFANAVEVGAFVLGVSTKKIAGTNTDFASIELVWSPGGLFSGADDEAYHGVNPEADASYFLVRGSWQNRHTFTGGWQWLNRAGGQAASGPLLPSEDYTIAGATAVRGYRERSARGRHGVHLSTEILTPPLPVPSAGQNRSMAWQLCAFADGGWASPSDDNPNAWLASAGLGIRARAGKHCTLSCDAAWPLLDPAGAAGADGPRVHITAQLTF